jgi:hypothetical protein
MGETYKIIWLLEKKSPAECAKLGAELAGQKDPTLTVWTMVTSFVV